MPDNPNRRHLERVARCGCAVCIHMGLAEPFDTPAQAHHIKEETGASDRQDDWLTFGACPEHHTGASGIHTLKARGFYTRYGVSELDLVAKVLRLIYGPLKRVA